MKLRFTRLLSTLLPYNEQYFIKTAASLKYFSFVSDIHNYYFKYYDFASAYAESYAVRAQRLVSQGSQQGNP